MSVAVPSQQIRFVFHCCYTCETYVIKDDVARVDIYDLIVVVKVFSLNCSIEHLMMDVL